MYNNNVKVFNVTSDQFNSSLLEKKKLTANFRKVVYQSIFTEKNPSKLPVSNSNAFVARGKKHQHSLQQMLSQVSVMAHWAEIADSLIKYRFFDNYCEVIVIHESQQI